eukprot:CCRYP_006437-RC/>CCRYP_006437-RC protein AED:0.45 eAED:0.45 QI:0/-1/0/1/-1/0/1/0/17
MLVIMDLQVLSHLNLAN